MTPPSSSEDKSISQALISAVLSAADPANLLQRTAIFNPGEITIGPNSLSLPENGRLLLIAIGKAAPAMAAAAVEIFGDRIDDGLVTLLPEHEFVDQPPLKTFQCDHPLPNEGSLAAGAHAADLLSECRPEDRVITLVSGGGSAMFEHLPDGIGLSEVQALTKAMLVQGLPIDQINRVRRQLSIVKGGGLAEMAAPAMTIGLILSDVIGDHPDLIASGPTVPSTTSEEDVQLVLESVDLWESLPTRIKERLRAAPGREPMIFQPVNVLIGGNEVALAAAAEQLAASGYRVGTHTTMMEGEASRVGRKFAQELVTLDPGEALLMGGEATVTVQADGHGGPIQELSLAAAIELAGGPPTTLLGLATDGIDGNSPAAGALVDETTVGKLNSKGLDPAASLEANDSYQALSAIGATIEIGLTGTNVNDIVIGWRPLETDP